MCDRLRGLHQKLSFSGNNKGRQKAWLRLPFFAIAANDDQPLSTILPGQLVYKQLLDEDAFPLDLMYA
jgi:hypothetical protein